MSFTALSLHRLFLRGAQSGVFLFVWILIFEYLYLTSTLERAAFYTALIFCAVHAVSFLLTPYSARAVRNGVQILGTKALASLICAYLVLVFSFLGAVSFWLGIAVFIFLLGVYRALYWIPYQAHMGERGVNTVYEILVACMPLVFGYIATLAPHPSAVLIAGSALVGISLISQRYIPDVVEKFPWRVGETFRAFFEASHRALVVRSAVDGAHATALFLLWPLAVFMLLSWSYALVGIVFSLTLFTILIARSILKYLGPAVLQKSSVRGAVVVSAWVLRLVAATPLAVIAVGAYAHALGNSRDEIDIVAFDHTPDQGVYLDEHTALKEMGSAFGKIVTAFFFAGLVGFLTITSAFTIVFILVALMSGARLVWGRAR